MNYYLRKSGVVSGPFSEEDVRHRLSQNRLTSMDEVSADAVSWKRIRQTPLWQPATAPAPVVVPSAPEPSQQHASGTSFHITPAVLHARRIALGKPTPEPPPPAPQPTFPEPSADWQSPEDTGVGMTPDTQPPTERIITGSPSSISIRPTTPRYSAPPVYEPSSDYPEGEEDDTLPPYPSGTTHIRDAPVKPQTPSMPPDIPSHMAKAVVTFLLFSRLCGLVGFIYATQVKGHVHAGRTQEALSASKSANSWCNWGIGIGIVIFVLAFIAGLAGD